ncbi:MAG: strawberry notch family protein [Paludibacteraceae bacterium]|nr:strawberry notch family protein [Paludibacteraceae bacterium]
MLHEILLQLVDNQGVQVLANPYLCGMCDDMLAFSNWKERPNRLVLRGMIADGTVCQLLQMESHEKEEISNLVSAFVSTDFAKDNSITDAMASYVLNSIAYAAGWGEMPVFHSDKGATQSQSAPEVKLGQQIVEYKPAAESESIGTMIPANMAIPVNRNLNRIVHEEGSLVDFLAYELQFTPEHVQQVLAAEQIDGVAMAIRQMQVGQGFILSDATGIGKGRQLAALIYWALLQCSVPVFVTEKSVLFSDLYRDLKDIGCGQLRPFILNSDREARVIDADGVCVVDLPSASEMEYFRVNHQLPDGYDFLALTYSQMSINETKNWKMSCVLDVVKDSYLILDESHNATGTDSNQGRFFRQAVNDACGVTFASATYAKNCSTMPLYALKTAIAESRIGAEDLIDIVESGGIILQEELSKGLVASGSMIRRERDMSDIQRELRFEKDDIRISSMRLAYDRVIEVVQDLQDFEVKFIKPYLKNIDIEDQLRKTLQIPDDVVIDAKSMRVIRESFASRFMPTVQQLLLATKTELAVQTTLEVLKSGRKPVVEIQHTMESQLDYLCNVGEELKSFEFIQILRRNLNAMFHYKLEATERKGKKKKAQKFADEFHFDIKALVNDAGNKEPKDAYEYLINRINSTITGLPVSPIDHFVFRIEQHGYKVGEMTQRKSRVDYKMGGPYMRVKRDKQDKKKIARDFNDGVIDVLIANKVAATGISLHASETFADQRQRVLISLEEQASADLSEQFQGRIDRTGQVVRGAYIKLASPIAAERRFMMMQEHKMRSLSSIVRADQRNVIDLGVVDIINGYGSRVVDEYLNDHPELFDLMSDIREKNGYYRDISSMVAKFMRNLAFLRSSVQEEVLDDVERRYKTLIDELNESGENELEVSVLPLEAELKNREVFASGNPNSESIFGKPAYLDTVEAKILRKPMTSKEMKQIYNQLFDPSDVVENTESAEYSKIIALRDRYTKLREEAQAKIDEIESNPESVSYTPSRLKQIYESANNFDKMQEQEKKIHEDYADMRDLLKLFKKGQPVGVPLSLNAGEISDSQLIDYISVGIFLGVKTTNSSLTRSNIKLVFAVNDGRRRIELPLTQCEKIEIIKAQTQMDIMKPRLRGVNFRNWDSLCPKEARETLYIITGNILLGIWKSGQFGNNIGDYRMRRLASAKGRGHLIIYTDNMGKVKHGYLMPRLFRPRDLTLYA